MSDPATRLNADLEGRYVASPEAQDAYWKGRAQWSRRDATGIPQAIELFNRAIEADTMYAKAYAGLADSWALLPQFVPTVDAEDALGARRLSHGARSRSTARSQSLMRRSAWSWRFARTVWGRSPSWDRRSR